MKTILNRTSWARWISREGREGFGYCCLISYCILFFRQVPRRLYSYWGASINDWQL